MAGVGTPGCAVPEPEQLRARLRCGFHTYTHAGGFARNGPAESTVVGLCAENGEDDPDADRVDVSVHDEETDPERDEVRHHELDRVAVDCDERDGRGELVVLLLGGTVRWRARGEQQRARCVARAPLSNSGRGLARAL